MSMSQLPDSLHRYAYFDRGDDVGILTWGGSEVEVMNEAALAMFDLITDTARLAETETVEIDFVEPDLEMALFRWLSQLLVKSKASGLLFKRCELKHEGIHWVGRATGESEASAGSSHMEIKGPCLASLRVSRLEQHWCGRCVLEV